MVEVETRKENQLKVLLGLAIEKSNIEADLMQMELPGSEIDLSGCN